MREILANNKINVGKHLRLKSRRTTYVNSGLLNCRCKIEYVSKISSIDSD